MSEVSIAIPATPLPRSMAAFQALVADTPHPSELEQLPPELLTEILAALSDDLPSLSSATLASRTLHAAFINAKRPVLSSVLVNHVGVDTIRDALAAAESIGEGWDASLVDPGKMPDLLTIDQVYCIAKLSTTVKAFAKLFVQSATDVRPEIQTRPPFPSERELARIERAFYRFETFRNVSRASSGDPNSFEKATNSFFDALGLWEVEQLGCIHDFVFRQIKPAYDDIASHDIRWGCLFVEPALNYACPEVQAIMSLGLASVYKIATAKTYAERHELLYRWNGPHRLDKFLYQALTHYRQVRLQQLWPGARSTPSREGDCDGDLGPQNAWEWAYARCAPRLDAYRLDCVDLRRWGYVFWDRARLDEMLLFGEPFHPPLYVAEEHEVGDAFEASWRARQSISRAGGTGYWSVTDQSQVVYPATRQPGRHRIGPPLVWPTFTNAKRELKAESLRIEAAMQKKGWTTN